MDDLKKSRIKKAISIIDKTVDDFSEALNRLELDRLYERRMVLKQKINSKTSEITKANARLQLQEVEKSIDALLEKIDIYRDINIDVDDDSAKKFIEDNPDIFLDDSLDFEYD